MNYFTLSWRTLFFVWNLIIKIQLYLFKNFLKLFFYKKYKCESIKTKFKKIFVINTDSDTNKY